MFFSVNTESISELELGVSMFHYSHLLSIKTNLTII